MFNYFLKRIHTYHFGKSTVVRKGIFNIIISMLIVTALAFSMCESIAYATESGQAMSSFDTNSVSEFAASNKSKRNTKTLADMHGVWIAFVDYKNMGLYNKSEEVFRTNADKMFKNLKKDKIDTVFFHVTSLIPP